MLRLATTFLLTACCLFAADRSEAAHEQDMTPWLWANFFILIGALGYLSMKYAGPFLAARTDAIRQGITDAEARKAEADRQVAEIDARLTNLDAEIDGLRTEMRAEQAREAERIAVRNQADLARMRQQTDQEIHSYAKAARLELQDHGGKLALQLAEQKIRSRMNPEAQTRLTEEFVRELK